ncbi:MAG: glycosyltransferase family A protein [Solirubrobacterales bacterium]
MADTDIQRPRVAVIVPCYNDGSTLPQTLGSIDEPEEIEVVVVDDGSTDDATLAVLAKLEADGVRVIHQVNKGLPEARNAGLAATSAPYVFPLDSDDMAVSGSLSKMADVLDAHPDAAASYGDWIEFGDGGEREKTVPRQFDPYMVAFRNRYPVASLFRRTTLEKTGGWHKVGDHVGYEDWNLWMSIAENHEPVIFAEGVFAIRYRIHGVRMLVQATSNHAALYETMKRNHPKLFAELPELRKDSSLSPIERMLYPHIFGARRPRGIKRRIRALRAKAESARARPTS